MPDFYTPVSIPKPSFSLDYHSGMLFLGSCFADHIGKRMKELKFRACPNPFGVLYNPLSLAGSLQKLIEKEQYTEADLSYYNELWFSYSHYTLFSDTDKQACLDKINESFREAKSLLREARVVFLTLGTSWVYRLKETGEVVSNCHKIPPQNFERFFTDVPGTVETLGRIIEKLRRYNPSLKFVFTVSPIRHWKDGAIENQRSKSALILSIAELQKSFPEIYYFPAYEIFMDELRDYRFYASDKLHPSETAQDYIWEKFKLSFLDAETLDILNSVERMVTSLRHKPRFPNTQAYKKFQATMLDSLTKLRHEHPFLDFNEELKTLNTV